MSRFLLVVCLLALVALSCQEICKQENMEVAKETVDGLCPIFAAMNHTLKDVIKCKERKRIDVMGTYERCAIDVFNNASYGTLDAVQKVSCDMTNPEVARKYTCCLLTSEAASVPGLTAQGASDICKKCALNPFE